MAKNLAPFVLNENSVKVSEFQTTAQGIISWQSLVDADTTSSEGMVLGLATVPPASANGHLALHRHEPHEIYYMLKGQGLVTIDSVDYPVKMGDVVFIPGNAEHGIRNTSEDEIRFIYIFPVDGFGGVGYIFSGINAS